jgi:hypothetical protein
MKNPLFQSIMVRLYTAERGLSLICRSDADHAKAKSLAKVARMLADSDAANDGRAEFWAKFALSMLEDS